MHSLSAQEIVKIWERGRNQHLLNKALTILLVGCPEKTWDQLVELTIGHRNRCLLELREKTFGSTLKGFAVCPNCGENLELAISISDLQIPSESRLDERENYQEVIVKDLKIKFRMPNSMDIGKVARSKELKNAERIIAQRCILETSANGKEVPVKKLSKKIIDELAGHMSECDSLAEMLLDLHCPTCRHKWQLNFDIVTFFWKEISMHAKRLLREVHTLAAVYKWREMDILSMSPVRRQYYLGMVT